MTKLVRKNLKTTNNKTVIGLHDESKSVLYLNGDVGGRIPNIDGFVRVIGCTKLQVLEGCLTGEITDEQYTSTNQLIVEHGDVTLNIYTSISDVNLVEIEVNVNDALVEVMLLSECNNSVTISSTIDRIMRISGLDGFGGIMTVQTMIGYMVMEGGKYSRVGFSHDNYIVHDICGGESNVLNSMGEFYMGDGSGCPLVDCDFDEDSLWVRAI